MTSALRNAKFSTMNKEVWHRFEVFKKMEQYGVVPTVYATSVKDYLHIIYALLKADLPIIEILLRENHGLPPKISLDAIYEARIQYPDVLVGAGTCQSAGRTNTAINQGAQFIVSNLVSEEVIRTAQVNCVPVTPGASTDSEVGQAMRLGCDTVKLLLPDRQKFREDPLENYRRLAFFKHFRDHFSRMVFFPTMNIREDEIYGLYKSGAPFVIMGATNEKLLETRNWQEITKKTKSFLYEIKKSRDLLNKLNY